MVSKSIRFDLLEIFKCSVAAVLPENIIRKCLSYNHFTQQLTIENKSYNLQNKNVYVVGTGKAVQNMSREIENILSSKIKHGIISIPIGSLNKDSVSKNIIYCEGAENNLPDVNAESTAKRVKDLVTKLGNDDLLLVLVSGGGSALLPLPKEPISLKEKISLIKNLANSGADIKELNTVRKKLSDIKGGQLAIKAQPAHVISLILSDIVGDPLDLIASGLTTENLDNPHKALDIVNKYNLYSDLPESIKEVLKKNEDFKQFPKANVENFIIGSNKISIAAALHESRKIGYLSIDLSNTVSGNVTGLAKEYSKLAKTLCHYLSAKMDMSTLQSHIKHLHIPGLNYNFIHDITDKNKNLCLILGGETTVQVKGTGKGGRNQQLALEFSKFIHEIKDDLEHFEIYLLSAGTDGIDGPTDAAGAIGYKHLISEAKKANLDVDMFLVNNDSYNFYKQFKNSCFQVITGHTNTNVMDIHLIILMKCV